VSAIGSPAISVEAANARRYERRFPCQQCLILLPLEDIGHDPARLMIKGSHSQRGCCLQPTNDHISSSSPSSTLHITTAGVALSLTVIKMGFTWWSVRAFF
jgi:hypothetical protein